MRCWHFVCPECGIGDGEWGHPAADDELHCEVCVAEDGRLVRLRRWLAKAPAPDVPPPGERSGRTPL